MPSTSNVKAPASSAHPQQSPTPSSSVRRKKKVGMLPQGEDTKMAGVTRTMKATTLTASKSLLEEQRVYHRSDRRPQARRLVKVGENMLVVDGTSSSAVPKICLKLNSSLAEAKSEQSQPGPGVSHDRHQPRSPVRAPPNSNRSICVGPIPCDCIISSHGRRKRRVEFLEHSKIIDECPLIGA